ncbi:MULTISPECIES: glycosyltransferase family 4 protein [Auritidibacter]|uniref:glycosyltransferase family 4 protein n=1 Tax=Auritidibacter TaxID=1160973 RepID=UPI0016944863|nr:MULTISPECIES: glycosyltransferase family 1 protein [Auritidibacter]NIH72257.1 glycosyltransferase involved in cell wall biosynthesis [Auritidibacter ignavus]WGH82493.1 glycosyltransferase family 1 protein [Auritidibacter ignavus]
MTTTLRLVMDARYTRTDFHDGISRYGSSLIEAVAAQHPVSMLISDTAQLKLLPNNVPWELMPAPTSPAEPFIARRINALEPDVVFSPMQTMGSWGRNYGLILTLHDLIYYQHRTPPHDLPAPVRGLWRLYHLAYWPQRLVLNRADAVATVSRTTQRLMRKHRLTTRPITVISNAAHEVSQPRDPHQQPDKSLVYMGSFMDYKNVNELVRAMAELPEYQLHLLSKISPQREEELAAVAAEAGVGSEQVILHHGTSEEEYHQLLRTATALVTLSRTEGFGLPLAEAMEEGTPVIVSDIEIFRDIAGEGPHAHFIDLQDSDWLSDFAQAAITLNQPEHFARASVAAREQSQCYRWEDSARRLIDLAYRVHDQRRRGA